MFVYVGEKLGLGHEEHVKILAGSSNHVARADAWFGPRLIDPLPALMVGLMRASTLMIHTFDFVFLHVNSWSAVSLQARENHRHFDD